jgi:hypothetical protein
MIPDPSVFECHITIEPVFGERFLKFEELCSPYKFRPAELLMQKSRTETPLRSSKDSFATSHGKDYFELKSRMDGLVAILKHNGFDVWRTKIEGILYDNRTPPLIRIKNQRS